MTKSLREAKVVDVEKRRYPSKHYVYVIEVSWSEGTQTVIYRRYSAFFEFQCGLLQKFPVEGGVKNPADRCIPFLPGKILFGRSHVRSVAEKRLGQINEYCKTLIRLPSNISDDSYVKNFFEVTPEDINPPTKKEKKKSADTANEISDPVLLEQYTAVADYKKQKGTECDLTAGQVVEVIDKNENGWWFVHLDDLNEGWVPATYLESVYGKSSSASPVMLKSGEEEVFITTSAYQAKNTDELTFDRGVLIEVFQKGLDGWWKGRYQDTEGFVPACYLFRYYGSMNTADGVQVVSTMQDAVHRETVSTTNSKSKNLHPKSHPFKGTVNIGGIKMNAGVDPYAEEPIYAPTPRKEEVQAMKKKFPAPFIAKPKPKSILPKSDSSGSFDTDSDDSNYAKPDVMFGKKSPDSEFEDDAIHDYETLGEHYRTIADFQAQASDGLSFKEGIEVSVITKNPSGWWFVEAGNEEGWVPSSYLEKTFKPLDGTSSEKMKPKPKPTLVKQNDGQNHFEKDVVKPKPQPPARRDTVSKTPVTIPLVPGGNAKPTPANTSKPKPPPPVRRDIVPSTKDNDYTDSGRSTSPPVPMTKPRPSVSKKPSVGPRKSTEGGSVAAMAAVLSQGFGNSSERRSTVGDSDRRPSVSKKPTVPRRNPAPEITVKGSSLKRSASSESLREIERPSDNRLSKSPYPGRTLSKQVSDSSSSKPGMKFLRKSTENLLAAQADEERKQMGSPVPAPRKLSGSGRPSPKSVPKTAPASNIGQTRPKPAPPSRNHIPPSKNQTLKLAGLEKALKSGKSPPPMPTKKFNSTSITSNKAMPPQRPNNGPNQKPKKTPPPRPGNSPATNKKIAYVTIADYGGYDDASISFSEGESVKVLEKNSDGWWYVEIGDREGWVPSTFIEISEKPDRPTAPPIKKAVPVPKPRPPVRKENMFRAVADYTVPVYDDSGINLLENEEYEVLEKADNGWWFVKKGSTEGWAPSSFLESL